MSGPTLYLMLGYPGAGKTTIARLIAKQTNAAHLSSDSVRLALFPSPQFTPEEHAKLYQELDHTTEELLSQGKSVIYDANLNQLQHRREKYDICARTNAKAVLVWVKTPQELAKERAVQDSRSKLIPPNEAADKMFDRLVEVFEAPKDDEPYITIDGSDTNEDAVRSVLKL